MAVQWEQTPSGQIVVEQNADWLVRAFGVLFLIPACYLAYYLLMAIFDYGGALLHGDLAIVGDLVVSIPGFLVTIITLLAFAMPAWMLIFARSRAVLDPTHRTITATRDFRLLRSSQQHSADAFDLVELAVDEASKSSSALFHLTLFGRRGARLDLAVVDDRAMSQALALAHCIAERFSFKLRARTAGWPADGAPVTLEPWEPAFWHRVARSFAADAANLAALLTGRRQITWQMINPWPSQTIPPVVLPRVQWAFKGAPFRTHSIFDKAVRAFQVEHGSSTDEWEPGATAVRAPRLVVEYTAPDASAWTTQRVQLTARNGECFTNGELLLQIHNAVVEQLRNTDLVYLQGIELVTAAGSEGAPVYRLRQMR
jgi:hypothetical protein